MSKAQHTNTSNPPTRNPDVKAASTSDFETQSISWDEGYEVTKTALFSLHTPNHAILQHIRTVTVSQLQDTSCEIDTLAEVNDLPDYVKQSLQNQGYEIVAGRIDE
jgi:hypothetical protein